MRPLIPILVLATAAPLASAAESTHTHVTAAGNARTEPERLRHLRAAASSQAANGSPDAELQREFATLLPVVTSWVEGRDRALADLNAPAPREVHRYLHDFFEDPTEDFTPPFPSPPRTDSPLYPLWAFYRGRFVAWYMIEHSASPERKKRFLEEAERCFDVARTAFPQNELLRIYSGENLPAPNLRAPDDRAPAWANHQRRALEQLHKIIRWWIAERQLPNGEFGGKWGDDVEMWRWWAPILIGFDDPVINAAQEKLAHGNLSRPGMAAGYTSQLTDVEHTAEETADTLTPMLHAFGPDSPWAAKTRRILELADRTWWGNNARGQLQFKHIDFNHEKLGANPGRAYDTGYHTRVLQPVLLLWQRTHDPALGEPLARWLRTWAEAALGTDNGKPAGIVPAALQWPSGRVGSTERGWVGPRLAGDAMESIYSFPSFPVRAMTAALLQAHVQTRDPIFLEPLLRMAELYRAHLRAGDSDGEPGTAAWAAHRLPQIISDPLAKWRQLTGDPRFDDLLRQRASGYVQRLLTGADPALTTQLADLADGLSHNWPMFTDEVRYTDRVLSFPHAWPRTVASGLKRIDHALLYSTVTGDPGSVETYPLNAVRWHTLPREIAALVTENRRDRFTAELYHFGAEPRSLSASLLTLEPGNYTWTLTDAAGRKLAEAKQTITQDSRRLSLLLPARTLCRVTLRPSNP